MPRTREEIFEPHLEMEVPLMHGACMEPRNRRSRGQEQDGLRADWER